MTTLLMIFLLLFSSAWFYLSYLEWKDERILKRELEELMDEIEKRYPEK